MDVLDGLLRFCIMNHDYAVKQHSFGPDYEEGLSLWYKEEEDKLQELVAYWEYYHGRVCIPRPTSLWRTPFESTCCCESRKDSDAQTNPH